MNTESEKALKKKVESYDISKSDETLHLATDLAKFIRENKLFLNIQGKEYVNVEGWQYAGSRLGILPVVEELTNLSDGNEIKYQARVKLLNLRTEQVVGSGFAICSNKENGKKYYQEFAIASMAQTRAIGKAYRNILAWVIRAAGYEPTPVEEMDYDSRPAASGGNTTSAQPSGFTQTQEVKPIVAAVPVEAEQTESKPATTKQKAEILLLLNNEVITAAEKEKMVNSINKLDFDRASQAIAKLKKVITDRQAGNVAA